MNSFQLCLSLTPALSFAGCACAGWGTDFIALCDGKDFHLVFIL